MSIPVLSLERVAKRYRTGGGELTVLNEVSFHVAAGERLAVVGPSGSGKSTLLGLMAGLDAPDSGRVVWKAVIYRRYHHQHWPAYVANAWVLYSKPTVCCRR